MAIMNKLVSAAAKSTGVAARTVQQRSAIAVRTFVTDATGKDDGYQKPQQQRQQRSQQQRQDRPPRNNNNNNNNQQQQQRSPKKDGNLLFGGNKNQQPRGERKSYEEKNQQPRSERKFSFALKDPNQNKKTTDGESDNTTTADKPQQQSQQKGHKKFGFAPSAKAKEVEVVLEHFDAPAYWNDDFPVDFDDSMKHEVEKLQVFSDFTMLLDESWQKEIHPQFDGSTIELILNAPLEDYDEHLFIDDKTTYDTKVVMHVPLACFNGLTPAALEIVKQLAGPRYNANKKMLKLTEDRYRTRVHNHKRLCDILRDLTQSAHELSTAQAEAASL